MRSSEKTHLVLKRYPESATWQGAEMKRGKWGRLLFSATPLLAGCAGFWAPPNSTTTTTTTTTLSSGDFYILDQGTTGSRILGDSIVSGKLTALSGSPYVVTGQAFDMALGPKGSGYLYVSSSAGVINYTINSSTGALTQGAQITQDTTAKSIQVDPGGAWLLEATDLGALNAIPITSTGAYDTTRTIQSVAMAGIQVQQMAIAPNHTLIAVSLGSTGTQVFPFTSSATSDPIGAPLSPTIAPANTSGVGSSQAVSFDPLNRLLYVGETAAFPTSTTGTGGLRAFTITSSPVSVKELSSSPYVTLGTGPHAIQSDAAGDYVYAASWQGTSGGVIEPFQVSSSGTTYSLTAQTKTTATGIEPAGLAEDNLGNFMLAIDQSGSPTLDAYIFDTTTTYQLDLTITDSTAVLPVAVVAVP